VDAPPTLKEAPVNDPDAKDVSTDEYQQEAEERAVEGTATILEPNTVQRSTPALRPYRVEVKILFFPRSTTSRPRTSCHIDGEQLRESRTLAVEVSVYCRYPLAQ
jgi:hypothetical protein